MMAVAVTAYVKGMFFMLLFGVSNVQVRTYLLFLFVLFKRSVTIQNDFIAFPTRNEYN